MDLTLLEIHLDGAQFGPATLGGRGEHDETVSSGATESGSGSVEGSRSAARRALRSAPIVIALGVAVGYAISRRFGRGDGSLDAEAVEIEA